MNFELTTNGVLLRGRLLQAESQLSGFKVSGEWIEQLVS
jgi:hypothetical protein